MLKTVIQGVWVARISNAFDWTQNVHTDEHYENAEYVKIENLGATAR